MGVYFDPISEYVYTVSEDKKFKVYNHRKESVVAGILLRFLIYLFIFKISIVVLLLVVMLEALVTTN